MRERGMLQWIDHYSPGRIVVPKSPLQYHGMSQMTGVPNARLVEHKRETYGGVLGLSNSEML
ncbi:hypothetical protein [Parvibaculum sp.]|jgi:CoA:oxalate CoA-transferase|uniref:hypothetical protein n=1 Tax=Parvibaculum sp. TaxID=2024848 RepID=UPI000C53DBDD|nr:hypothetical protein [Parvibaculum sp.]MAM94395.1 hypothetical protein [Parvibaculum sp.]HCX67397.1 hypothetical protein [Rhodobiaceae bacterium]|tara:strand:- start:2809 stop:2994 length:186 start_codon:yes stop_codon:yes gene_type:complete